MRAALPLLLAIAPLPALAEGAVQVWACTATASCSTAVGQENDCAPVEPAEHRFEIAPRDTDAEGRGSYRISHNGTSFEGTGLGFTGRFEWQESATMGFSLRADPRPEGQVQFSLLIAPLDQSAPMQRLILDCEVTR